MSEDRFSDDVSGLRLTVAGLFAGVGGFELGLAAAGHRTVLFCENWEPARAVLARRFSGIPNHPDVRDLAGLFAALSPAACLTHNLGASIVRLSFSRRTSVGCRPGSRS